MSDPKSVLETLTQSCRILEMEGHGDMTLGHVSARDPDGRGFWMKRNAIGLGEVLGPEDFVLLDLESGEILKGKGGRHSEWHIHAAILCARPDVTAVAHTHPAAVCALSALDTAVLPLGIEANYFDHPIPRFVESAVLIKTPELGASLAQALDSGFAIVMANHGATFCGRSIEEMTLFGIWFDAACRMQLQLSSSLHTIHIPSDSELAERKGQILSDVHIRHSWDYYTRKLNKAHPPGTNFYGV